MKIDEAMKIVASGETTPEDIGRDVRRLLHHGEFFAAAVLTLVLHGRKIGAFRELAANMATPPDDAVVLRALSGETVDE